MGGSARLSFVPFNSSTPLAILAPPNGLVGPLNGQFGWTAESGLLLGSFIFGSGPPWALRENNNTGNHDATLTLAAGPTITHLRWRLWVQTTTQAGRFFAELDTAGNQVYLGAEFVPTGTGTIVAELYNQVNVEHATLTLTPLTWMDIDVQRSPGTLTLSVDGVIVAGIAPDTVMSANVDKLTMRLRHDTGNNLFHVKQMALQRS